LGVCDLEPELIKPAEDTSAHTLESATTVLMWLYLAPFLAQDVVQEQSGSAGFLCKSRTTNQTFPHPAACSGKRDAGERCKSEYRAAIFVKIV
jgi:hypothetical protein